MVPRATLPSAVALNGMGFNVARSVGLAVGGLIVAAAGAAAAFLVNAASYLGLIGVLLGWRSPPRDASLPQERLGMAMAAGVRYVAMSPQIGVVLLRAVAFGLAASAVPAMMPLVARDLVHEGEAGGDDQADRHGMGGELGPAARCVAWRRTIPTCGSRSGPTTG